MNTDNDGRRVIDNREIIDRCMRTLLRALEDPDGRTRVEAARVLLGDQLARACWRKKYGASEPGKL